ncbi:MAG: T9SS type B sorting domain-containing protein [Weeksellaceae bacterium]
MLENPDQVDLSQYTIEWTFPDGQTHIGPEINRAKQIGTYSVHIIDRNTLCTTPHYEFQVSEVAPPEIVELVVTNESEIEVLAVGDSKFTIEYSIDGINYQDSPIFKDLAYGVYTIWVRYKENLECLGAPKQTILLQINNFITPNGDGKNDKLIINNLDVFGNQESTLVIYDRYGKEIYKKSDNRRIEWDGYYLGRPLNTTDYWYQLMLPDGRIKSGHITLKNF